MRVLLATDGSPHAEHAAALLSRLPHAEPLEVTVMTTVILPDVGSGAPLTGSPFTGAPSPETPSIGTPAVAWETEFLEQQQELAKQHYAHIEGMFEGADARLQHRMGGGHVGQSIVEAAKEIDADLIVLGAKGHSAVERILLGSVSDFVATHASCSVLVVRPNLVNRPVEQFHVTIAYDGSEPSEAALEQFAQFGWGSASECHLLNILPVIRTFRQDMLPGEVAHRAERRAAAVRANERAVERLRYAAPRAESHVMESDHIAETIVSFAESHRADLVVVGSTGHSAIHRILLGSVSRYVLRHAAGSVWIIRRRR